MVIRSNSSVVLNPETNHCVDCMVPLRFSISEGTANATERPQDYWSQFDNGIEEISEDYYPPLLSVVYGTQALNTMQSLLVWHKDFAICMVIARHLLCLEYWLHCCVLSTGCFHAVSQP